MVYIFAVVRLALPDQRLLHLLVVLSLLVALPAWAQETLRRPFVSKVELSPEVAQDFLQAEKAWGEENYERAARLYARVLEKMPGLKVAKWQYGLFCFFGGRGLFTLTPVLLLALPALWRGCRRGTAVFEEGAPGRAEAVAVLVGFVGLASFIVLRTNNYGGGHYGMRWFLMMVPLLMYLMQPLLEELRGWGWRVALAVLILPGLYTAQVFWFGKPTAYELLLMRNGLLILPP